MPDLQQLPPQLQALMEATPKNFRVISQIYTDQLSLVRRTMNAVTTAFSQAEAAGPSKLFDFSNDSLKSLALTDSLIEIHTRIVDLLIMTALGQNIETSEFQDYAKILVPLYTSFNFLERLKNSSLKDPVLQKLEQEWKGGTDFTRVQNLFKAATRAVSQAGVYCKLTITPLPEF